MTIDYDDPTRSRRTSDGTAAALGGPCGWTRVKPAEPARPGDPGPYRAAMGLRPTGRMGRRDVGRGGLVRPHHRTHPPPRGAGGEPGGLGPRLRRRDG